MKTQKNLSTFSKLLYLIFLDLNQPFGFDECLSVVQTIYPACTKKLLRSRIKEMIQKNYLTKQRIKRNICYKCLVLPKHLPAASTPVSSYPHENFFLCGL